MIQQTEANLAGTAAVDNESQPIVFIEAEQQEQEG